jgi:hypothetical protein
MTDNLDAIKKLIENLSNSQGSPLPGLTYEEVSTAIIEKDTNFQKNIGPQSEFTEEEVTSIKENYKSLIKDEVNTNIMIVKSSYKQIEDSSSLLKENVTSAISSVAIPPAIGTTSPVVPNPAYALLEAKQKKNQWLAILNNIFSSFGALLIAALKIKYEIPQSVIVLMSTLETLKSLIDTIPT